MAPTTPNVTSWQDFITTQEQHEYPLPTPQISALQTLFSDPSIPISQIAHDITRPIVAALEQDPKSPVDCYRLWRTIADAVKALTDYNDRLVELVVEIQKVPDPVGYIAFMQDFREYWNEFAWSINEPDPSTDPPTTPSQADHIAWLNLQSFSAKLSTRGVPQLNELSRSGSILRDALEDIAAAPEVLDWRVPAATVWIKIAGKQIFEMKGQMEGEYEWEKTSWEGERGWSRERWGFWRKRFEELSRSDGLEGRTKDLAREAAGIMEKIEEAV